LGIALVGRHIVLLGLGFIPTDIAGKQAGFVALLRLWRSKATKQHNKDGMNGEAEAPPQTKRGRSLNVAAR
jgi:hypothetical protein